MILDSLFRNCLSEILQSECVTGLIMSGFKRLQIYAGIPVNYQFKFIHSQTSTYSDYKLSNLYFVNYRN